MPAGLSSIEVGWVKKGTLESEHATAAAITKAVPSGATLLRQLLVDAVLLMQCVVCAVISEPQVEGEEETLRRRKGGISKRPREYVDSRGVGDFGIQPVVPLGVRVQQVAARDREPGARDVQARDLRNQSGRQVIAQSRLRGV